MRAALWLMALFAIAVAAALFAGNNPGSVTLYWPPYRVDLSLNFVLLVLIGGFLTLHYALRALSALWNIPQQARQWRLLQKERAMQAALLESLSHLVSGRFVRARKSAEHLVALEESVTKSGEHLSYAGRLRAMAHLVAAESAHAVQDRTLRDQHFQQALGHAQHRDGQDVRDGVHLRAARWAFDDRDAPAAMDWLDRLPQGAARRTLAMRLRFKAARLAGKSRMALETVRLLTKRRAFSDAAGRSIARGLALEMLRNAHDPVQIQRVWGVLDKAEQQLPEVAMEAGNRLLVMGGVAAQCREWLLPVWDAMVNHPQGQESLPLSLRVQLVRVLERSFGSAGDAPDAQWLSRIEQAQMGNPRDPVLQYLAGVVCMRLSLWGKAQQLLKQSLSLLQDAELRRDAWSALAEMAEQRQDAKAATEAYRAALQETVKH
jgi:HemY protein